jgi:hypothetical protein
VGRTCGECVYNRIFDSTGSSNKKSGCRKRGDPRCCSQGLDRTSKYQNHAAVNRLFDLLTTVVNKSKIKFTESYCTCPLPGQYPLPHVAAHSSVSVKMSAKNWTTRLASLLSSAMTAQDRSANACSNKIILFRHWPRQASVGTRILKLLR